MSSNSRARTVSIFPELKPVVAAISSLARQNGRYGFHQYLTEVYRVGCDWSQRKIRKRRTKELIRTAEIEAQRDLHTFRAIIEATFPSPQAKQTSRWTRALEYALLSKIPVSELAMHFKKKGGVARCARDAAEEIPKRRYRRPTWD